MRMRDVAVTVTHTADGRPTQGNSAADFTRTEAGRPSPMAGIVDEERPWGDFRQLVCNEEVTVKVITVQPGQRLSLQRHSQRGELWQVLDGPLDITLDDQEWMALAGEAIWVPVGSIHRIGNPGRTAGRVLELAFGHFDEEDIDRLHDDYSR